MDQPGAAYASAEGREYYERDSTCDEYLAFHYPGEDFLAALLGPRAPALEGRYPFAVSRWWDARPEGRALDVGAACGRTTLDLARDHRLAVGLDLSRRLIRAAEDVRRSGRARYRTVVEGSLLREHVVAVEPRANAGFLVADALVLPFPDGAFDTVVALNLVDRVPDPGRAVDELGRVTAPGGALLIGSPYTWLPGFTPRARWLGGFEREGRPVRGFDAVRERLAPEFELQEEGQLPFFIPHHARSGQLGLAHLQKYRRKS